MNILKAKPLRLALLTAGLAVLLALCFAAPSYADSPEEIAFGGTYTVDATNGATYSITNIKDGDKTTLKITPGCTGVLTVTGGSDLSSGYVTLCDPSGIPLSKKLSFTAFSETDPSVNFGVIPGKTYLLEFSGMTPSDYDIDDYDYYDDEDWGDEDYEDEDWDYEDEDDYYDEDWDYEDEDYWDEDYDDSDYDDVDENDGDITEESDTCTIQFGYAIGKDQAGKSRSKAKTIRTHKSYYAMLPAGEATSSRWMKVKLKKGRFKLTAWGLVNGNVTVNCLPSKGRAKGCKKLTAHAEDNFASHTVSGRLTKTCTLYVKVSRPSLYTSGFVTIKVNQ